MTIKQTLASLIVASLTLSTGVFAEDGQNPIKSFDSPGYRAITAFDRAVRGTKIGGYMDTELHVGGSSTEFRAHRLVLGVSSQLHDRVLFSSEVEYEYGGQINGDDDSKPGELKLEQAWVDLKINDDHAIRTGIVLMPFGRLNILHDSDVRDATQRPIYTKYIVPSTWRDTGTGLVGDVDAGDWEINYEAYFVNGFNSTAASANISDKDGIRNIRPNFKDDNNEDSAFIGRVGVSPFIGFEVGLSYYTGSHTADNNQDVSMMGLDLYYKSGPWEFIAEGAEVGIQGGSVSRMSGFYAESRYHFFPEFFKDTFFGRGFSRPTFTWFSRFSQVDTDESVVSQYDRTQITLGLNYRPMETLVYKIEYEINNEAVNETYNNALIMSVAVGF